MKIFSRLQTSLSKIKLLRFGLVRNALQVLFDAESNALLGESTCRFTTPNDFDIRLVNAAVELNSTLVFSDSSGLERGTTVAIVDEHSLDVAALVHVGADHFEATTPLVSEADLVSPRIIAPLRGTYSIAYQFLICVRATMHKLTSGTTEIVNNAKQMLSVRSQVLHHAIS